MSEENVNAINRMKELLIVLNEASKIYYQGQDELMSNFEYDKLYDELLALETETGIILSGSPTQRVGYEVLSELPKERHNYPVLSLDKTKDVGTLASWLGDHSGVLSWKLDGLTVVITYENGIMTKTVTRGNGEVGEVITNNARMFVNLPLTIPYKGKVVLRGEALIKYKDFEKINEQITDPSEKYKNPRNLCSGSVRQLNNKITAERKVYVLIYSIIDCERDFILKSEQFDWIKEQGFDVVGYDIVDMDTISNTVKKYSEQIIHNDFPSDGLVLSYDNIEYGESLGRTAKFPRHSIAFKWADETAETELLDIEWSASRTGLINPVAIFEPVELEGTTVARASVHNVSIVESLKLGIGDKITVYKANMIIPQIADNLTESGSAIIPDKCPVCDSKTEIRQENGIKTLVCNNPECLAKKIKSFTHFVSRSAMNIDGLSEASIEKLIAKRIIREPADIFHLDEYKEEIIDMDGFGEKSFNNLVQSAETSKLVRPDNFIYSLGITGIGLSNARMICKAFHNDFNKASMATEEELTKVDGIGEILAHEWVKFMNNEHNKHIINDLLKEIHFNIPLQNEGKQKFEGVTVVITGSLTHYSSRNDLKKIIEDLGGKVTGSVTKNTTYLINNDINSNSSKNKKAKELGVQIISEDDFMTNFEL